MKVKLWPLFAVSFLTFAVSTQVFAASVGSISLSGSVSSNAGLVVATNGSNNTNLNILGGEVAKNIATVTESSNNHSGYTVTVSSAHGGELWLNGIDSVHKTTFQISYNGSAYFTPTIAPVVAKTVTNLTQLTSANSDVLINVVAFPEALEGAYSGIINLTLTTNQ